MSRRQPLRAPSGDGLAGEPRAKPADSSTPRPEPGRVERTLHDLVGFAEQAQRLVARGRASFDGDEFQRLAAEAILHRIGEAVARLDTHAPDFLAAHPEVSWRPMKGMRNVVAHEYGAIDYDIVWNALANALPVEAEAFRRLLDEQAPGT